MLYTNQEIINFILDDIEANPRKLVEDQMCDQNFISLFGGKSDHEIRGVILNYPLNANIFASVLYDRVISKGVVEGLNTKDKFSIFRREELKNAERWYRIATDVKDVNVFDPNSSPIPKTDSRIGVCYSDEPIRIRIDFTFSPQQLATAFESETGLSELLSAEMKAVRDTVNIYRNQVMIDKIKSVIENQQVPDNYLFDFSSYQQDPVIMNFKSYFKNLGGRGITIDYLNYIFNTGVQSDSTSNGSTSNGSTSSDSTFNVKQKTALEYFVDTFKITLLDDLKRMSEPSRNFNKGDSDGAYMRSLNKENAVLIINSRLATLNDFYKKINLNDYFTEVIEINDTEIAVGSNIYLAYMIVDKNFFEIRDMLDTTLDWTNPKSLYTNYFTHVWFGTLTNPFVNAYARTLDNV